MATPLTLRMAFRADAPRRVDCSPAGQLNLTGEGTMTTNDAARGERLELTWNWRGKLEFAVRGIATETPRLNGVVGELFGPLTAGARLEWRGWTVDVAQVAFPTPEERRQLDAARTSDDALLVFADTLENRGAIADATWVRLIIDAEKNASQLRALAQQVPSSVKALTARARIERCSEGCEQRWEDLPLGETPWVRKCRRCADDVSWAETPLSAPDAGPVAIDPTTPRTRDDLLPPLHPVG